MWLEARLCKPAARPSSLLPAPSISPFSASSPSATGFEPPLHLVLSTINHHLMSSPITHHAAIGSVQRYPHQRVTAHLPAQGHATSDERFDCALDRSTGLYPSSALFGRPRVLGKGLCSRTKCPVCSTAVALGRRGWAGRVGTIIPFLQSTYHNLYATGVKAAPLPTRSLGGRDPVCLVVRRDDGGQV